MNRHELAVVGAGISGLAAAFYAARARPSSRIILLEAESRLGGKILTENLSGFVIEGGAEGFLTRKTGAWELCRDLGLSRSLHGQNETQKGAYVRLDGRLHKLPTGLSGLVPVDTEALKGAGFLSPEAIARIEAERTMPARTVWAEESVETFFTRRFGAEAFQKLMEPLMTGIYGAEASRLSAEAAFPQLTALEREGLSLLQGLSRNETLSVVKPSRPAFVSLPDGLGTVVTSLANELKRRGVEIRQGVRVQELSRFPTGKGFVLTGRNGALAAADRVILALPAWSAARLLARTAPGPAALLSEIPYASVATVNLIFKDACSLPLPPGTGYVIPRIEKSRILACTWSSRKWPGRAPAGGLVMRFYLGRAGDETTWRLSDRSLLAEVRSEIGAVFGADPEPDEVRVFRWPRSMPQLNLGHKGLLEALSRSMADEEKAGLFLTGGYFRGVGLPDCVSQAMETVMRLLREPLPT